MWIVAVGWAYVVILMAATETSVIAGIMTFFGYCVLPLSILFYIAGAGKRRQRRADASAYSTARPGTRPDGADASVPLTSPGFFLPSSDNSHSSHCGSADSGSGGDCGGDGGGGGGGD
ncbi:hypothetical protein LK540_02115 [Massilia sp. IC2-278]|uniref:hypothetical protein n=1 Tax=Massilia sp. IC2-278 TaxID=2887200 RepID=UPI001E45624D|nr:hypothetical protein [Massilia sp. IC2-278]MCC2959220.1 hypothetical protein [Massilia sp. IC2-278]